MIRVATAATVAALLTGCTSIRATQATFEGTRWQITAINGHAAPGSYVTIAFAKRRFTAQLGCNTARGIYTVLPDTLRLEGVMMTERGCSDVPPTGIALTTYDEWGRLILTRPMRVTWHSDRRLTLSNAAGSLALELQR